MKFIRETIVIIGEKNIIADIIYDFELFNLCQMFLFLPMRDTFWKWLNWFLLYNEEQYYLFL